MVASNPVTARLWLISHIGSWRIFKASVLAAATLLLSWQLALAQFTQQGPKLVGTGAVGLAGQGYSVALSTQSLAGLLMAQTSELCGSTPVATAGGYSRAAS
jgi:hypothetical protein